MANNQNLVAVIMAGGAGMRFWPLSTDECPKQFLTLIGHRSLLQLSYDRVRGLIPAECVLVLTQKRLVGKVREQLPELPPENVIGEPMRRDTAGAVALGAALCRKRFGNSIMAVLTADHWIEPVEQFQKALLSAAQAAQATGDMVTLGIQPRFSATGYGYLERGAALGEVGGVAQFRLARFKEKPDKPTAEKFVAAGNYFWNSGMFVWPVQTIWLALQKHLPRHPAVLEPLMAFDKTPAWDEKLHAAFAQLWPISIDFGVMEKVDNLRVVPCTFDWNDLGGWLALECYYPEAPSHNRGRGNVYAEGAAGNFVFCEDERETVALVGVKDLVVVRAGNRTLVAHRDQAEQVKRLVEQMNAAKPASS